MDKIDDVLAHALTVILDVQAELSNEEILKVEASIAFIAEAFDNENRELRGEI